MSTLQSTPIRPWAALLDEARNDPARQSACSRLGADAARILREPILRRVYRYQDIGQHRSFMIPVAAQLDEAIRELYALSLSDDIACRTMAAELPLLCAAFRLTGEDGYRRRVLDQLEEISTWSPLQRPGWTCYIAGRRLPPDGKDGANLGTGVGVRAIADALDTLPADTLGADLRKRLERLLAAEIEGLVDDWRTRRPWYVKGDNPITNQWVLPTEGMVRACLALGTEQWRDAYALGVHNLLRALDAHGSAGEFEEGVHYANFTVVSLLHAARAMALAGDMRAIEHPFLAHYPTWCVHHLQPGRLAINAFDAFEVSPAPRDSRVFRAMFSLLAACTQSPVARWALAYQFDGPTDDLPGLAARAIPPPPVQDAPPLFAAYERATRVNWRSSWDDAASGLWVRGGHPADQHDHRDRGHVSYIRRGRPIFIEAGTPSYHNKDITRLYKSGAGHNVLQVGTEMPEQPATAIVVLEVPGWQRAGVVAPIAVQRLDAQGGDVSLDISSGYDSLAHWRRAVAWTADELRVRDEVGIPARPAYCSSGGIWEPRNAPSSPAKAGSSQ